MSLAEWKGVPRPGRTSLEGRYCRLEPLEAARHAGTLFEASGAPGAEARFRYLFDPVPSDAASFTAWVEKASAGTDPLFFAVIDKATGRAEGRQALMRVDAHHGVIEIGNIMWGPAIARTRVATEALFLTAEHVFALGYRRFEWKCHDGNQPSKQAALRFGFRHEGVFRQHMVAKGGNRDTAWFSIIDGEWPGLAAAYRTWLAPGNFDEAGVQKDRLRFA